MDNIKLTEKEIHLLVSICNDDVISDNGWYSNDNNFWIGGYWEDYANDKFDIKLTSIRGLVSSLNKKGVICTDGESGRITNKGIEWLKAHCEKLDIPSIR